MSPEVLQIIEKIQLTDDIFERANMINYLREEEQVRPVEIARLLDIKPAYISHYLRLLKLPEIIVDGYYSKLVSSTHLFIIARLHSFEAMMDVYEQVLAENLSAVQTEERVREILHGTKTMGERFTNTEVHNLTTAIQNLFGDVQVKVIQTRIKAKLIIETKGNQEKTTKLLRRFSRKVSEIKQSP